MEDVTDNFIIDWDDADSNDSDVGSGIDTEEPVTVAARCKV
jgi:hypothetical protein